MARSDAHTVDEYLDELPPDRREEKNYYSLYLMGVYGDPEQESLLQKGFTEAGKKLNMGKSCVRFRKLEDIPLDVIGKLIADCPPAKLIEHYENSRRGRRQ